MIYFTQNTVTQAIKIGYSANPKKRRSGLQIASPDPFTVIGVISGGLADERWLHEKFAKQRLNGEWFQGEILGAVQRIISLNPMDKPPLSNIFVFGDRHFAHKHVVFAALDERQAKNPVAVLITPDTLALDRWAWEWAEKNDVEIGRYYTEWSRYGRGAPAKVGKRLIGAQYDPKTFLVFQEGSGSSDMTRLVKRVQKKKEIELVVKSVPVSIRNPVAVQFPGLLNPSVVRNLPGSLFTDSRRCRATTCRRPTVIALGLATILRNKTLQFRAGKTGLELSVDRPIEIGDAVDEHPSGSGAPGIPVAVGHRPECSPRVGTAPTGSGSEHLQ